MRGAQYGGQKETDQQAFERLLKSSPHFADALNSHRRATATVVAEVIGLLLASGKLETAEVLKLLHELEHRGGSPSDASAVRLAVAMVRDHLLAAAAK